jgi:hypothetical protein
MKPKHPRWALITLIILVFVVLFKQLFLFSFVARNADSRSPSCGAVLTFVLPILFLKSSFCTFFTSRLTMPAGFSDFFS